MLPEWEDIPGLGARLNGLFRQSWRLLNDLAEEEDLDEIADLMDEAIALENSIANHRINDLLSRK